MYDMIHFVPRVKDCPLNIEEQYQTFKDTNAGFDVEVPIFYGLVP
jgi:hypothetical protein